MQATELHELLVGRLYCRVMQTLGRMKQGLYPGNCLGLDPPLDFVDKPQDTVTKLQQSYKCIHNNMSVTRTYWF